MGGVPGYNLLLYLKSSKVMCILCDFLIDVLQQRSRLLSLLRLSMEYKKLYFCCFEGQWSEHFLCSNVFVVVVVVVL